jgi:hypothetical protein
LRGTTIVTVNVVAVLPTLRMTPAGKTAQGADEGWATKETTGDDGSAAWAGCADASCGATSTIRPTARASGPRRVGLRARRSGRTVPHPRSTCT